jgi:hypothetical protein
LRAIETQPYYRRLPNRSYASTIARETRYTIFAIGMCRTKHARSVCKLLHSSRNTLCSLHSCSISAPPNDCTLFPTPHLLSCEPLFHTSNAPTTYHHHASAHPQDIAPRRVGVHDLQRGLQHNERSTVGDGRCEMASLRGMHNPTVRESPRERLELATLRCTYNRTSGLRSVPDRGQLRRPFRELGNAWLCGGLGTLSHRDLGLERRYIGVSRR